MGKLLSKYLEKIGEELSDLTIAGNDGVVRPITKDEQLARAIWDQALGYETVTENAEGHKCHRVIAPDPKMMQFIIERREGKSLIPLDTKSAKLLDKISALGKSRANDAAHRATNDNNETHEN